MALGNIWGLFGFKKRQRLDELLKKLRESLYFEYKAKAQSAVVGNLTEAEKDLAVQRKKAEQAVLFAAKSYGKKTGLLRLQAKYPLQMRQGKILSGIIWIATNQEHFLDDIKMPMNRVSIHLDRAVGIPVLQDDPDIKNLSEKISELIKLIDEYCNQLSLQCREIDLHLRKRIPTSFLSPQNKPELWSEKEKLRKLNDLVRELFVEGVQRLEEKIAQLTSNENLAGKFREKILGIAKNIEELIAAADKLESVYYLDNKLPISHLPEKTSELGAVSISRSKYPQTQDFAGQMDAQAKEIMELLNELAKHLRIRREHGTVQVFDVSRLNEDMESLSEQTGKINANIKVLISRQQFKDD